MAKLKKADINKIRKAQEEVLFYGTPEEGYSDSGLWKFLEHVYTKDAVDLEHPKKKLLGEGDVYAIVVFLYMLACQSLLIPKSRQIRMSWFSCTFGLWTAKGGPFRHVIYQTKKEEDGFDQTTKGREAPGEGRMDFIEQHLPSHLRDPHFIGGRGNTAGGLRFTPTEFGTDGMYVPWHGSKINGIPQGAKQVRQHTPTLYINDESAFQAEYKSAMIAAGACAKKMISVSSVDSGSFFNQACLNMKPGEEPGHRGIHPVVAIGLEKMGIEWPKGLESWQTKSGTWVLQVHYSSDPKKDPARDGAEWYKKAVLRDGYEGSYDSDGWQTEMEINYNRGGGAPVFPQVRPGSKVFVDSDPVDRMRKGHRFFAGYDYGARNPSAFEVLAVDRDNLIKSAWELYEPCTNMADHVAKIKRCPYWDLIEVVVGDPSIMSRTQQGAADVRTLAELFEEHGLYLVRGRRGQDVTIAQMLNGDHWKDMDNPGLLLTKATPSLNAEVMDLRWDKHVSEVLDIRKNAPERIRDKNNHGFDAVALILDYGVQPYIPEIAKPTAGTYKQAIDDLRVITARAKRKSGGIHVV